MNNRIRELAEQAGFYFYDMHNVDGQDLGETVEADSWRVPEAFAKLIVQECCALIAPSQELKKDPSFPYMGGAEGVELLDGSVRLIKEHFGVEE